MRLGWLTLASLTLIVGCHTSPEPAKLPSVDRILLPNGHAIIVDKPSDDFRWTDGDRTGYAMLSVEPSQRTYTLLPSKGAADVGSIYRFDRQPDGSWKGTHAEITIAGARIVGTATLEPGELK
ncbi:MAG: hypothetical protein QM770_02755 [Tepidisphaeraceae bacterium]